jgi:hypothetical protein
MARKNTLKAASSITRPAWRRPGDPEQAVARLVATGRSNRQTASELYLPAVGGPNGVAAWAFPVNQDKTLPDSPFGPVVPAAAQQSAKHCFHRGRSRGHHRR